MPVIHYPGYITREEAALRQNVQVRTINERIKRKAIPHIKVGSFVYVRDDKAVNIIPPPNVSLKNLVWVSHLAEKNKLIPERIYEQIIMDNITGVVLGDRVFVIANEPTLVSFLKTAYRHDVSRKYPGLQR